MLPDTDTLQVSLKKRKNIALPPIDRLPTAGMAYVAPICCENYNSLSNPLNTPGLAR